MYEYVEASSSWKQKGHSKGGKAEQDMFGSSVAINDAGDRWIAGSTGSDSNTGAARIYEYSSPSNTWLQVGSDLSGFESGDYFGFAVSMNRSGSRVFVDAPTFGTSLHGYVSAYWIKRDRIEYDGVALGESVAIDGDGYHVATGSPSYKVW